MITIVAITACIVLGVFIFIKTAPQFGKQVEGIRLSEIKASPNYQEDHFQNLVETKMDMGLKDLGNVMYEWLFNTKGKSPSQPIPAKFDLTTENINDTSAHITWFGHSAILLEIEGYKLLLDPMLGPASSPVPFMTKRFPYEEPIRLDDINDIDAVIISHDHYDHLDYHTITTIHEKVGHFYTALAVGEHLRRWGVPDEKITELDWWESSSLGSLKFTAAPARHFSGRGLSDRNKTQWASWIIKGAHHNIYFSGDSGYADHFKEIGQKFGPFDFAMVECGQYNERWAAIHMMPEQSVQAAIDVTAKRMMPIHWGGFQLALHTWKDPVERAKAEATKKGVQLVHPCIGERIEVKKEPTKAWWLDIQ
ncbi:MAG: MBL fold metallo-hydrolase [Cyclobacteriaceae bacterium]|nr:MBL fold metallo-hydrolase [Cyclobacteriaceae bacterium HetDA_MAG_MS6]